MRLIGLALLFVLVVFVLPALAAAAWWELQERPRRWSEADWSSSSLLPEATASPDAAIYVMAARTGGFKGAFAVHSWIVTKRAGASRYDRYDKVGWGSPVRRNGYPADARWYSNEPWIVRAVYGREAEGLIPAIEAAIEAYPFARPGDYHIWPGPNSNSFVSHVLASVPELKAVLPPHATGRDFAPGFASLVWSPVARDLHATLGGYAGISAGATSGLELHLLGLVAGFDFANPGLKIPAFGTLSFDGSAAASN